MKLLIVEDEAELAADIARYFSDANTLCERAATVAEALERVQLYPYDCILLDITLPDGSGLEVLRELKRLGRTDGVIILSARDSVDDRIEGIRIGADDYLPKPFHLAELAVRILAITRRNQFQGRNVVEAGGLTLDLLAHTASHGGRPLPLTPTEYRLLHYLVASAGKVLSKTALAEYIVGDRADLLGSFDLVYAHMKNLKRKLAEAGCTDHIRTIYATGYKFEA
ncbi:MAG: response regulator transcription factor [Bacteroidetes bacterium]|nr:response regulator transcription factor [Bacteroidota bacterium]